MVCGLVDEGWMIGLTWFHPKHDSKWLFVTTDILSLNNYFEIDEKIEWSSWIDGFNYDPKSMIPSRWKDVSRLHMIRSWRFSQLSLGKKKFPSSHD
jgi:hypothetical protein